MDESQSPREPKALRSADAERGEMIRFFFDGRPIEAYPGESVAAALRAAGILALRRSPREGSPRGSFCWMGLCQECTVVADGVRRPACRLEVAGGMVVSSGAVP
ncbi:MAG: (2Fe-2S)-binding protein [Proteobacteria bacterium]|nr:(2Fe-2S)-binding protein [Pseudomonadota bacterium]